MDHNDDVDVILDSNIFLADIHFRHQINTLGEYLKVTDGRFVLSSVVLTESTAVYERQLEQALRAVDNASRDMKRLAPSYELPELNPAAFVDAFNERMLNFPERGNRLILSLNSDDVNSLTIQAARRIRPFNLEGHNFRDAAIWYSIIRHARDNAQVQIAFISNNYKEFAVSKSNPELHSDLQEQLTSHGIHNVRYFRSISAFLQEYLPPIDVIDLTKVLTALDGDARQLEPFYKSIEANLYEDEDGNGNDRGLGLSDVSPFKWEPTIVKPYKLSELDTYVVAEVRAQIEVDEYRLVGVITDDERDEIYEDYDIFHMLLTLTGRLALTIRSGKVRQTELLRVSPDELIEAKDVSYTTCVTQNDLPF